MIDQSRPLTSVCSDIGRGHPVYLDSVLTVLRALPGFEPRMIETISCNRFDHGLSGLAWRAVRLGYSFGALGGPATWLYNQLRSPRTRPSAIQLWLLGSDLRRELTGYDGVCLVDHPLLAAILQDTCRVAYLHAEIAAPRPAAVPEAWRTFVPLEWTAARLEAFGVRRENIVVTGLVIEPELLAVAEAAFKARLDRLATTTPLTVGFFISGAYPRPHALKLIAAAASTTAAGHRALIFWGQGWLRAAKVQVNLRKLNVPEDKARLVWSRSRSDETARSAATLPELDVMVAAAHERTNWAVGLGLPMFALLPHIGPFAKENYEFAAAQEVCLKLDSMDAAYGFGGLLNELRDSGRLAAMARSGWGRLPVNGAEETARCLLGSIDARTSG